MLARCDMLTLAPGDMHLRVAPSPGEKNFQGGPLIPSPFSLGCWQQIELPFPSPFRYLPSKTRREQKGVCKC